MGCTGIIYHTTSLLQVGLAIGIAVIVAVYLTDVSVDLANLETYSYQCLLGADYGSSSLCTYTFVVCGVSLAVSAAASLLLCCTCQLCGLGKIVDVIVAAFGAIWWAVASGVIGSNAEDALPAGVDPAKAAEVQQWRDAVPIMAWVECGLFCVLVVSGLFRACTCCRK